MRLLVVPSLEGRAYQEKDWYLGRQGREDSRWVFAGWVSMWWEEPPTHLLASSCGRQLGLQEQQVR